MALPKIKDFNDYDKYMTEEDFTTSAQAQEYFSNQGELLTAVIQSSYWQPQTNYTEGDIVKSDSMPSGTEAICVADGGGISSNVEPSWGAVGGANISDGTCFWQLRWKHWSKDIATQAEAEAGTDNASVMTPKGVNYRLNKDRQLKVYKSVLSIGLTTDASLTMDAIYNAMPIQSVLYIEGTSAISQIFPNRDYFGVIEIVKFGENRTSAKLVSDSHKYYYGDFSGGVFNGWKQLVATDDALTLEEIQASTSLTNKIPNADAVKQISYTDEVVTTSDDFVWNTRTYNDGIVEMWITETLTGTWGVWGSLYHWRPIPFSSVAALRLPYTLVEFITKSVISMDNSVSTLVAEYTAHSRLQYVNVDLIRPTETSQTSFTVAIYVKGKRW